MSRKQIIAGISLLGLAGIIFYMSRRRKTNFIKQQRAEEVAEHGYETAHDVLFPKKKRRVKKYRGV
jgi:hypothetical protein